MTRTLTITLIAALGSLCGCESATCPEGMAVPPGVRFSLDECVAESTDAGRDAEPPPADAGPCGGPCDTSTPICDTDTNTCVACLADTDCADPDTARCDAGECVPCTDSAQCDGIAGNEVCETGTCVECSITDEAPCLGNSCDPASNTCTTTPIGLAMACEACVADSECAANHRCVPMTFMGAPHGDYCMKVASTGCARPFAGTLLMNRTSSSGADPDDYCPVDESAVSCEAVRALLLSRSCAGGVSDCMADGARCETVGGVPAQCTYSCGVNNNCPSSLNCVGGYCS